MTMQTLFEALYWLAPIVLMYFVAAWLADVVMPKLEMWFEAKIKQMLEWVNSAMEFIDHD